MHGETAKTDDRFLLVTGCEQALALIPEKLDISKQLSIAFASLKYKHK